MKQIALLLFALAITSLALAQTNSLQEGNNCFAKGDYACAIEKYKEAIKSPDKRQLKIAGDNLRQAEKCFDFLDIMRQSTICHPVKAHNYLSANIHLLFAMVQWSNA